MAVFQRGGQGVENFFDGQQFTDHASRIRQNLGGITTGDLCQRGTHPVGIIQPALAGTSVGIAGVGHQVAQLLFTLLPSNMLLGNLHRGSAEGVAGKVGGNAGAVVKCHDHQVLAARLLDSRRGGTQTEAANRVHKGEGLFADGHVRSSLV